MHGEYAFELDMFRLSCFFSSLCFFKCIIEKNFFSGDLYTKALKQNTLIVVIAST